MTREPRPDPENRVGLRLELLTTDRDRLLVVAAEHGMSMAAYARHVVLKDLDEKRPAKDRPRGKRPKRS